MKNLELEDDTDITDAIGRTLLTNNLEEKMNKVNFQDVTFMSLSLGAFSGATTYLVAHDYPVAGGLFMIGIVLTYLYHKLGNA